MTSQASVSFRVDFGDGSSSIYTLTDTIEFITKSYAFAGIYNVTMRTIDLAYANAVPASNLTVNVTGPPSCNPPFLSIENQGTFDNPVQVQRSQILTLTSVTIMSCAFDNTNTKAWSLNKVDPSTGALVGSPIDTTSNPSRFSGSNQAILVVYSNVLGYGKFLFKYTVTVRYTRNGGLTYSTTQADVSTYVQIVLTGLDVFGLPRGILQQTYGISQHVVLDAGVNTKDLDSFVDPRTLSFAFYCQVVPSGKATSYFTDRFSIVTRFNATNFYQVKNTSTALNTPSTECLTSKTLYLLKAPVYSAYKMVFFVTQIIQISLKLVFLS